MRPQLYISLSPRVKGRHALSLYLCLEGIFEDSFTPGVLHPVAMFAEAGHLLHQAHHLVHHLTLALLDEAPPLHSPLLLGELA